jgi:acetyl esterase/lipase
MRQRVARIGAILLCVCALYGCASGFFAVLNAGGTPRGVAVERDRRYADDLDERLDVYRPDATAGAPVVVFFYGGRWQDGSRHDYAFVGRALASRGLITVVPDYREYPEVRFPTFVEDAALVVAWTRTHVARLGGDPRRIYLAGHSAGAHIATLLGTDARYLATVGMEPRDLAGIVAIAGPHDFLPITDADLAEIFGPPERYSDSQPVSFVDGDEPPFLLLHGEDDDAVRVRNSESLAARLRAVDVACDLRLYPGVGHVRILAAIDPDYARLAPTLDDVVRFVGR